MQINGLLIINQETEILRFLKSVDGFLMKNPEKSQCSLL